ncbi:nucleotide-diphospho-sugar transferase [Blyttiomyces helicus]|uniref:Nucleotide-diphospho-sugar transferase n=1 Tax=Blyttiomyces helicus TaxID=388810 RepID=A0A4P9WE18_9FUNG|nr:nucleotide-diphospho-sugar transferase [Blyttiomyces helicus]|eukprot:RKO90824.1 nucleotide-diphospho-sugar transferase [Blyttiomyces helicus]
MSQSDTSLPDARAHSQLTLRMCGFLHTNRLVTILFTLTAVISLSLYNLGLGNATSRSHAHPADYYGPRTSFRDSNEIVQRYPAIDIAADKLAALQQGCSEFLLANTTQKPATGVAPAYTSPITLPEVPKNLFFLHIFPTLEHPRYLCAIEAAAQVNPNHRITILAENASSFELSITSLRAALPRSVSARIQTRQLDIASYLEGTPLEPWYANGVYKNYRADWHKINFGDALRLAVLWNEGGTYLDLDIISINPVDPLSRMMSFQLEGEGLNGAALVFPPKDPFLWNLMDEYVRGYDGNHWGIQGPYLLDRTVKSICPTLASTAFKSPAVAEQQAPVPTKDPAQCTGLTILSTSAFYPISYHTADTFFAPYIGECSLLGRLRTDSYGLHWWNALFKKDPLDYDSIMGRVMRSQCLATVDTLGLERLGFKVGTSPA